VVVLLKTAKTRWAALEAAVKAHHPYEAPELLALPVTAGLEGYLDWIESETA
jgi:periplasmic divalent cation tolerance protein